MMWDRVKTNPTLYKTALTEDEGDSFRWHTHANQPHSSQVFCVSLFGALRNLCKRDSIVQQILGAAKLTSEERDWTASLEYEDESLLSEFGGSQPTSIDALLKSKNSLFCIEAKFLRDAKAGFGKCSQPKSVNGVSKCAGFFGPGSDMGTQTNAWCRLEAWDGRRSPRTYWTLGRAYFRDSVYARQSEGETCPFNRPHFQLMRNFLFSASLAQREKKSQFGVIVVAPSKFANSLESQITDFRNNVLQPSFGQLIQLVQYEQIVEILMGADASDSTELGVFLAERLNSLIH
ncbi:PGN_0703 family putative restriction endonuclease [Rhodopirellula sallentina]|uniref:Uncharacterized protein n=1 Tax=Rhodopirellula sallentina SM41 TaxID=1263870 RepID=M5UBL6_9BACT|nr:hypothetical protein [Rhodopirellula sallentina]EMI55231.1 hypothetical protein RSSM_03368 [Rhodopirellula sallentina SM41]